MLPAIAGKSKPRVQSSGSAVSASDSEDGSFSGSKILLEEQGTLSPSASSRTGSSRVLTDGLQHQYAPIQTADCLPVLSSVADTEGSCSVVSSSSAVGETICARPPSSSKPPSGGQRRPHRLHATTRAQLPKTMICRATPVNEIERALTDWPWHVVPPLQVPPGQEGQKPPVPNVPSSATGIFVLSEVKLYTFTSQYVAEIAAAYETLPLVIILLDVPNTLADADLMLEAQTAFRYAGADDVIFAPDCNEATLKLTVAMSVQRVGWRGEDHQVISQALQEQEKVEQAAERDKMFWSCAHRVFTGFPKIDPMAHANLGDSSCLSGHQVGSTSLGDKLGQGAFGTVHIGVDKETGQYEAVKVLKKSSMDELHKVCNLWREITLLRKLRHPGIVRLIKVLHLRRYVTIHMEVAGRLSLYDYISKNGGRLDMPNVWELGSQVAEAISHCHSLQIAHRDIKHENIVIATASNGQVRAKIIDFGLAVEVGCYGTEQRCGTMPYCPPEMLRGVRNGVVSAASASASRSADPRCADVWAFGIVNLEMAGGLGLLSRLLDWPDIVEASEERGIELIKLLGSNGSDSLAKALRNFQIDPQREDHQHLRPGEVLRSSSFMQLLVGQLQIDANKRFKMQDVDMQMSSQQRRPQVAERVASTPRSTAEDSRKPAAVAAGEEVLRRSTRSSSGTCTSTHYSKGASPANFNSAEGCAAVNPGMFCSTPVQPTTSKPATGTRPVPVQRKVMTKSEAIAAVKEGLRW